MNLGLIIVAVIVFLCVFLLVARIYTAKGRKRDEASQAASSDADEGTDAEAGE